MHYTFSSRLKLFHQLDLLKDVSRRSGHGQDVVSHPVGEQPPQRLVFLPPSPSILILAPLPATEQ